MKRTIIILSIIAPATFFFVILYRDYYKKNNVNFYFEKKIKFNFLPDNEINYIVAENRENLYACLSKIMDTIEYKKLELNKLDFLNYDYIISFKREITKISYSKAYSSKYKFHCDYIKEIPLELTYSQKVSNNAIFIYKIKEKNKYRHLVP